MEVNYYNYNNIINKYGAKKELKEYERKLLSRALAMEKIISDANDTRGDYQDE